MHLGGSQQNTSIPNYRCVNVDYVKECGTGTVIVDVREASELDSSDIKTVPNAINYPLGSLLRDAASDTLQHGLKDKEIITVCNVGYRSGVAAQHLSSFGLKSASLEGGTEAYHAPKSAWFKPDYVVVLLTCDEEKATLAASIATASQAAGRCTALVLMSSAPLLFRKNDVACEKGKRYEDIKIGEPFKPLAIVIKTFLSKGGTIFGCRSCVKFSGLEYSKLEEFVFPLQAPDLVRMTAAASGSTELA
eukprot:gene4362-6650_t